MLKKLLQPKFILAFLLFVLLLGGGLYYWISMSYGPAEEALRYLETTSSYEVIEEEDYFAFLPVESQADRKAGMIFYPGGQIRVESYAALAAELAERGYPVFLVQMPYELAILGWSRAEDVVRDYPKISSWYLIGHSLGGAMAARFLNRKNPENFVGLIMLGAYPAAADDISGQDLQVLSIYGSEDQVMDKELFRERKELLPPAARFVEIPGGNHAGFGQYGEQEGDGLAEISFEKQLEQTVKAILDLLD